MVQSSEKTSICILPVLICDPLRAKRLGYQAAAAGARAFELERDGGVSAVQRPGY